jgi:hypothetical protein
MHLGQKMSRSGHPHHRLAVRLGSVSERHLVYHPASSHTLKIYKGAEGQLGAIQRVVSPLSHPTTPMQDELR